MDGYVGIDVSKERLDVMLEWGEQRAGQRFTNTVTGYAKLDGWRRRRLKVEQVHVFLEATGTYGDGLARYLHGQGYRVSVMNPARIKGYAESHMQRNKTDKLDAAHRRFLSTAAVGAVDATHARGAGAPAVGPSPG